MTPTYKYDIKRKGYRQENAFLPGPMSPEYSLFPASLNHDKLIGSSMNPRNAGGLVWRHTLPDPEQREEELFYG